MQFKPFTIGKYEFIELLGRGGMAEVYRVKLRGAGSFQKHFAVKRILPGNWANPKVVERFEQEAALNSILTHPNIVQVFEFFRTSDTYFLVMEFVEGWNLRQLLSKSQSDGVPLPVELSIYLVNEVLKGLDYAHRKLHPETGEPLHIIHRDISPANIMVSREGAVKLCDFGVAKVKSQETQTDTGLLLGKAPYMSPEQARGERLDHRSDMFSVTAVFWELLVGRKLFAGDSEMSTLRLARECRVVSPTSVNPHLPLQLDRIVMRALAASPADRYQTVAEMQEELQDFQASFCPSYTQRKVSETVLRLFTGEAPPRVKPEEQEVVPFFPEEEKAMLVGLKRLGDYIEDPKSHLLGETRPFAAPARPARRRKRRRSHDIVTMMDQEPRFKEIGEITKSVRFRRYARIALLLFAVGSALGLLALAQRVDVPHLSGFLESLSGGRFPARVPSAECPVNIVSTPAGAEVSMDHILRGTTPLTLSAVCGSAPEISVSLAGRRTISRRLTLKTPGERVDFDLPSLVPGSLEVTLKRNTRVYVDEKLVATVKAGGVFRYALEPGTKYHVIFTDEATGKSFIKTYSGSDGTLVRETIDFDE